MLNFHKGKKMGGEGRTGNRVASEPMGDDEHATKLFPYFRFSQQ
jgi:hypothetical protein